MGHFLISAAHKSSGKTTISIGLCAALKQKNYCVQAFKKGPDYIDPMWLSKATGRPCYNLDFYTMEQQEILQTFSRGISRGNSAQISLIEGNKGLYDGLDLEGSNSNAALARLLQAPVVLVIDAQGMTRGIAPLILGYQAFEPNINIAGVILNKLGGSRHESKLRAVIEHYTAVPVIGAVHRNADLKILERHLGLIPSNEISAAEQHIQSVGTLIAQQVDLDKLVAIADTAKLSLPMVEASEKPISPKVKIGIAMDAAFGFYYPDDMEAFAQAGAELVPINTLQDSTLPPIDGLFIGGGFPETHMPQLSNNKSLRSAIANAIEDGLPVYAECGGLMYLTRSIAWADKKYDMAGVLDADTVMHEKPQGRGYVLLQETEHHPWPRVSSTGPLAGHEFHYSSLENLGNKVQFAYRVKRGAGVNGKYDGILYKNLLANYSHLRNVKNNQWVTRFVECVRRHKANNFLNSQACN
jgi:cobyrinic acid a,c-diamide synthase